ncbi:MAG: hypothetical protein LBP55_09935 [Candidatus Adiutrix sp.]|nr:hypothetical protein [Candidatus Adiutrix sp.]
MILKNNACYYLTVPYGGKKVGRLNFGNSDVASVSLSATDSSQQNERRVKFDGSAVAEVAGDEIYGFDEPIPDRAILRQAMADWLSERGWLKEFSNLDTGWDNIHVSRSSVKSVVSHGSGRGKIQALAALPDLIKNGTYLETQTDDNGLKRHFFAAKLNINNKPMVVGFIVKEDTQGRKYYEHELTETENLGPTGVSSAETEGGLTRTDRDSVMSIVKKHLGVKPDVTLQQSPRGSVQIHDNNYLINLFKAAGPAGHPS